MKPDWDKLMSEINGRGGTTLVGDVDCTAAGKPLCDSNGVQGFPTIKFGDPSALEDYQGGRSYADILKHAETLKPSCSPSNLDLCDDDAKAEINKFMDMDDAKLDGLIEEKNDEIAAAEKHFEKTLRRERLQHCCRQRLRTWYDESCESRQSQSRQRRIVNIFFFVVDRCFFYRFFFY